MGFGLGPSDLGLYRLSLSPATRMPMSISPPDINIPGILRSDRPPPGRMPGNLELK
jgi:hypothetical protein